MIKKLKILAIAMLATGATVSDTTAKPVPTTTNILQNVTVALTLYAPGPIKEKGTSTVVSNVASSAFATKALLPLVESATQASTTNALPFTKAATLGLLTIPASVIPGSTNIDYVTNATATNIVGFTNATATNATGITYATSFVNVATNTLVVGTNSLALYSDSVSTSTNGSNASTTNTTLTTNDLVIGLASGDSVRFTATNGTTNLIVVTAGGYGPTTTGYTNTSITLDANQTVLIGTNPPLELETNAALGGTSEPIDANGVIILTNGVPTVTNLIGTNMLTISTNSNVITVQIGTGTNGITYYTNAGGTNTVYSVDLGSTNNVIVDTNGVGSGFSTAGSLTADTLTTGITLYTNSVTSTNTIAGALTTNTTTSTNVALVTTALDYTTALVTNPISTNYVTNFTTNAVSTNIVATTTIIGGAPTFVIADAGTNFEVPTNVLNVQLTPKADILGGTSVAGVPTVATDWSIQDITFFDGTTNSTNFSFKLQGLVKSTLAPFAIAKDPSLGTNKVDVTNSTWTVNGWGFNGTNDIVIGGTITVGAPAKDPSFGAPVNP